jgi:hypothetical protein
LHQTVLLDLSHSILIPDEIEGDQKPTYGEEHIHQQGGVADELPFNLFRVVEHDAGVVQREECVPLHVKEEYQEAGYCPVGQKKRGKND